MRGSGKVRWWERRWVAGKGNETMGRGNKTVGIMKEK